VLAGGVIIVLHIRSLIAPIDDLLDATRSVRAGDLSARAVVTTSDEIGLLAASLNEMLDSLEAAADEVRASRLRIVAAGEAERRRIERNIHDGAQQQLTALALQLEVLRTGATTDPKLADGLGQAMDRLRETHRELRELAHGLHPSLLSTDGLAPALEQLADRAGVPASVRAANGRFDEAVEAVAYFVASEALANVAKYAHATSVAIQLEQQGGQIVLEVVDDGVGGAHVGEGSGLTGLADRVEAVGGTLTIDSPHGVGTTILAELPVTREAVGA
jgi:signal transduction histidine kinase